jgi:hypothetical protein
MIPDVSGEPGKILNMDANDMGTSFWMASSFGQIATRILLQGTCQHVGISASSRLIPPGGRNEDLDRQVSFD